MRCLWAPSTNIGSPIHQETIGIRLAQLLDIATKLDAIGTVLRLHIHSGKELGDVLPRLQLPALDTLAMVVIELVDDLTWARKVLVDELAIEA